MSFKVRPLTSWTRNGSVPMSQADTPRRTRLRSVVNMVAYPDLNRREYRPWR